MNHSTGQPTTGTATIPVGGSKALVFKFGPIISRVQSTITTGLPGLTVASGSIIVLTGAGFGNTNATQLSVNGAVLSISQISDQQITAYLPASYSGLVQFTVANGNGQHTVNVMTGAGTGRTPTAALRDTSGGIRLGAYASSTLANGGGVFASDPSSAQDPSGNTFVVARDNSSTVWSNIFNIGSQSWAGWQSAGGSIQGVPAMAVDVGGTGWIAARDTFTSYWLLSYSPGTGYGPWIRFGGAFATDPVVATCGDGSIYIVGKDSFNALWSGRYIPGTGFKGFQLGGGLVQGKPSVTCGNDNAIYIVARDNFNSSWVARVTGNSWTGWFNGGAATSIDPRIAALGGSLAIVILDAGGSVWRASFTEGAANGWQSWTGIGGSLADIAPAANGGQLYLVGRASNGLWWWLQTGNQWTWIGNSGVIAGALSAAPR